MENDEPPNNPTAVTPIPSTSYAKELKPVDEKRKFSLIVVGILAAIVLFIIVTVTFFTLRDQNLKRESISRSSEFKSPTPISNWKVYAKNGISFKYPSAWGITEEEDAFWMIRLSPDDATTSHMQGVKEYQVYVHTSKNTKKLSAQQIWKEQIKEGVRTPEFTEVTLNGYNGIKISNNSFDSHDVQYIFTNDEATIYLSLNYYMKDYEEAKKKYPNSEKIFDQILSTLEFTNKVSQPTSCADVKTGIIEIVDGPFRITSTQEVAGEVDIVGKIISKKVTLFGEEHEMVYIVIDDNNNTESFKTFLNNYLNVARSGNSVNYIENNKLTFKLGTTTNGSFQTQSAVDEKSLAQITKSINTNEQIKLHLKIPIYGGSGAPADFSYACEYSAKS